uniref:Ig-like domain-containing protein n=2 Tax=Anabas testudineus TaxID=64144 RepID=A0A3Q1J748_ANATE
MASPMCIFGLTCLFVWKMVQMKEESLSVHQAAHFVSVKSGENVTLQCFSKDEAAKLYWYKQTLERELKLISTFYKYEEKGPFYGEFSNNPRFTLDNDKGKNDLTITDVRTSDSATYYCMSCSLYTLEILEGISVGVKGSGLNIQPLVHQSASETIQPGDSVTLNCTVHTGSCDGEHSVYWFKDSEESHPGIIYTHGDRNDQCERKPDTQTNTCIYNLPLKNLTLSHAGTYYCAVASCGHLLFGNGTKLDFRDSHVLVYVLSGALTFTTILAGFLIFSLYIKTNNYQCTESQARLPAPSTTNAEDYRDEDNLHYAALSVNLPKRLRREKNSTETHCVYTSVKL